MVQSCYSCCVKIVQNGQFSERVCLYSAQHITYNAPYVASAYKQIVRAEAKTYLADVQNGIEMF